MLSKRSFAYGGLLLSYLVKDGPEKAKMQGEDGQERMARFLYVLKERGAATEGKSKNRLFPKRPSH